MATSLELVASGAQANVAAPPSGVTPIFTGWSGGRVLPESQVKSTPVDTSPHTQLTLTLSVTAVQVRNPASGAVEGVPHGAPGYSPELYVMVETLSDGVWVELRRFKALGPGTQSAVVNGLGAQTRASWWYRQPDDSGARTVRDRLSFTFALTAAALPTAA